jgi:hypothetical protein
MKAKTLKEIVSWIIVVAVVYLESVVAGIWIKYHP